MPTINEVWEQALQINANLVTVHNDLTGLTQRSDETNAWLGELRQLVADGLASISTGISGLQVRQDLTNQLLFVLLQQQKAVICNLEEISRNTCTLVNQSTRQTALQEGMAEALSSLQYMFATANPDAALSYARHQEERRRLEACCPPPERTDPCAYERCQAPELPPERQLERYKGFHPEPSQVHRDQDRGPR